MKSRTTPIKGGVPSSGSLKSIVTDVADSSVSVIGVGTPGRSEAWERGIERDSHIHRLTVHCVVV